MDGPDTVDQDDLLVAFILSDDTQTVCTGSATGSPTLPSGFTELHSGVAKTGGGDCCGFAMWKIAAAGDVATGTPISYAITWPAGSPQGSVTWFRLTGHDATTPIDASSVDTTAAGATQIVLTGVTTSVADCRLIGAFGVDESSGALDPYWADPPISGWTALLGTASTSSGQGGSSTYAGAATSTQASAGASGNKTASIDTQNDGIVGFLIAIAPSAGGPVTIDGTLSVTTGLTADAAITGAFTPGIGHFRWYTDATPDASMTALAAEDGTPTLTGAQMQNAIVRMRVQLAETGGVGGSGALTMQYRSPSAAAWTNVEAQTFTSEGAWFRFANGAATAGGTIGSQLLTGTDTSGIYVEDSGTNITLGANETKEFDIAVLVHWPPPDSTVDFQLLLDATPIPSTVVTLTTSTAANRPHTITRLDGDGAQKTTREVRFAPWRRVFYDAQSGYWWAFFVQYLTPTVIRSYYWNGSGGWTAGATYTSAQDAFQTRAAFAAVQTATGLTVYTHTGTSGSTRLFNRGTITGTSLSWGSEQSVAQTTSRHTHITVDDGGYVWIAGTDTGVGIWARRATNPDSVSAWQTAVTAAESTVVSGDILAIVGLTSDKALVLWRPSGTSAIKYVVITGASAGSVANATVTASAGPEDWGIARADGFVYLVHSDADGTGGNWVLRVYTESSETWATGTAPGITGQPSSNDGIPVVASDRALYAFGTEVGTEGGQDRILFFKRYHGPGASGTWDARVDMDPGGRGNADHISSTASGAGGRVIALLAWGDDDTPVNARAVEYWSVDEAVGSPYTDIYGDTYSGLEIGVNLSATADLGSVTQTIQGTLSITSSLSATAASTKPITGTLSVATGLTASVSVDKPIDGSLAITSSLTSDAVADKPIDGTLTVATGLNADATADKPVDGSVSVTIGLTADSAVTHSAQGTLAITAGLSTTAVKTIPISGASYEDQFGDTFSGMEIVATRVSDGSIGATTQNAQGTLAVTVGLTADASVVKSTSGTLNVATGFTDAMASDKPIAADALAITAGLTSDATIGAVTHSAQGSLAITATVTADSEAIKPIDGSLAITVGTNADGEQTKPIDGSLGITTVLTSDAAISGQSIDGSLTETVTLSASADVARNAQGSLVTTADITADSLPVRNVDGSLSITASSNATGSSDKPIDGSLPITVNQTADGFVGAAPITIQGSLLIAAALNGALSRDANAIATRSITANLTAIVVAIKAISSSLPIAVNATGTMNTDQPSNGTLAVGVGLTADMTLGKIGGQIVPQIRSTVTLTAKSRDIATLSV